MTEKGCDNCYYAYFDARAYPCSLCIRGIKRTDNWMPSKKTKAEIQTDCDRYAIVNDEGERVYNCIGCQTDCKDCKREGNNVCWDCMIKPQMERSDKDD